MAVGRVLVIAGSDSSGGAGLEADQKVLAAHKCYAMTATTALTAQNTQGVHDVLITPPSFVSKQIDACFEDAGVDVVKIGMLASTDTVQTVARLLRHRDVQIVLDPVIVATSGAQLLPEDAMQTLITELLPSVMLLTPNIPEARLLLQKAGHNPRDVESLEDLADLAAAVQRLGPEHVLLKGGHIPLRSQNPGSGTVEGKRMAIDILQATESSFTLETDYIQSKNTHGTGCSLASAVAANLAQGKDVYEAVRAAKYYIDAGIRTSEDLGKGNGPINHFHSIYRLPFAAGHFIDYILQHPDVKSAWKEFTEHVFVQKLGDGSLPKECFKYYLIQDYLYLIHFSRANALAAYKAHDIDSISASASIVQHIHSEMELHLDYCREFGLSKEDVKSHEESQACTAYTRYILDVGQSSDWMALQMALAPCLLGYGMIAKTLYDDPKTKKEGNDYMKWIENYVADDFKQAVKTGSDLLEKHALEQSPHRIEELIKIFIHATKMETGFWDMGVGAGK